MNTFVIRNNNDEPYEFTGSEELCLRHIALRFDFEFFNEKDLVHELKRQGEVVIYGLSAGNLKTIIELKDHS